MCRTQEEEARNAFKTWVKMKRLQKYEEIQQSQREIMKQMTEEEEAEEEREMRHLAYKELVKSNHIHKFPKKTGYTSYHYKLDNFIADRTQWVVIDGRSSFKLSINRRIVRGYGLGFFSFLIYILDLRQYSAINIMCKYEDDLS